MHLTLPYPAQSGGRFFRKECVRGYRFGFNGQMKDDEVYGEGNSYTAEYWQYDPRLGRRWNVDPMTEYYPWQSPYCVFNNSPISLNDIYGLEGDEPREKKNKKGDVIGHYESATDVKQMDLSGKSTKLNLFVTGTEKSSDYIAPGLPSEPEGADFLYMKLDNIDQLISNVEYLKSQGYEIGNIMFSSHGNRKGASFRIGNTLINYSNRKSFSNKLEHLGTLLSSNSDVVIAACHTGSPSHYGFELSGYIASTLNKTVYSSQSWVSMGAKFNEPLGMKNSDDDYVPGQQGLGKWTKSSPVIETENGYKTIQGDNLIIHVNGTISFTPFIPKVAKCIATKLVTNSK